MGKSTCAAMFREAGIPVHDADAAVHDLYRGAAVPFIQAAFPGVVSDGIVDRAALSKRVIGDPPALKLLEGIVHPLVTGHREAFALTAMQAGERVVVFDVPLLLETGGQKACDLVCVVSASFDVQKQRVLQRPDMTEEKFLAINAKQMPDSEKRLHAHVIIRSDRGLEAARRQIDGLSRSVAGMQGADRSRMNE